MKDILPFAKQCKYAVEATTGPKGQPQAAVVGIVVSDTFEVFFDTRCSSRKLENIRRDSRVAFVLGCDEAWTIQLEGDADEPTGDDLARLKTLYFERFPDGRDREKWPDITYVRVRPRWVRFSDFRTAEPMIGERRADPD